MSQPTDAEILAACDTRPRAFASLVERHHAVLHRYAARRLGAADAEDVVAETFAVAYQRRHRFDPAVADARPWLFGIATRLIQRHGRDEARRLRAFARTGVDPVAAHDAPAVDERGQAVARALVGMKRQHRDVLFLYAVAELSYEEIAVALDVPVGTVKGWLHRAREHAQRELGADDSLPDVIEPRPERAL